MKWSRGQYEVSELENVYTANDARAKLILRSLDKYSNNLEDIKGLGFCVSVKHAEFMAAAFNQAGILAALSGQNYPG